MSIRRPKASAPPNRELVGFISVDSGQVMVGDPSYLDTWKDNEYLGPDIHREMFGDDDYTYSGACMATLSAVGHGQLGNDYPSRACVTRTADGDGVFPVYVEREPSGRIVRMVVELAGTLTDE